MRAVPEPVPTPEVTEIQVLELVTFQEQPVVAVTGIEMLPPCQPNAGMELGAVTEPVTKLAATA